MGGKQGELRHLNIQAAKWCVMLVGNCMVNGGLLGLLTPPGVLLKCRLVVCIFIRVKLWKFRAFLCFPIQH